MAKLADHRIEPVDEGHRGDDLGPPRAVAKLERLREVDAERLLADDVLPGLERGEDERPVQGVRCADVHDVECIVSSELVRTRVDAPGSQCRGRGASAVGSARGERPELTTGETYGTGVDCADEANADDRGPQLLVAHWTRISKVLQIVEQKSLDSAAEGH